MDDPSRRSRGGGRDELSEDDKRLGLRTRVPSREWEWTERTTETGLGLFKTPSGVWKDRGRGSGLRRLVRVSVITQSTTCLYRVTGVSKEVVREELPDMEFPDESCLGVTLRNI